jgi:hypothetical protein
MNKLKIVCIGSARTGGRPPSCEIARKESAAPGRFAEYCGEMNKLLRFRKIYGACRVDIRVRTIEQYPWLFVI